MPNKLEYVSGIVDSAELKKSGSTNGREWNIYKVIIDGTEFVGWDEEWLSLVGLYGKYAYKIDIKEYKGTTRENLVLLKPFTNKVVTPSVTSTVGRSTNYSNPSETTLGAIASIKTDLAVVLKKLDAIYEKLEPSLGSLEDE